METQQLTINDLINSPAFEKFVHEELNAVLDKRDSREDVTWKGFKYRRDWVDRMQSAKILSAYSFVYHAKFIWQKKSKVNTEFRVIIDLICRNALNKMIFAVKNTQLEHE